MKGKLHMVTIDKIFHAQMALKNIIRPTPLAKAYGIAPECSLYFKPENLLNTGSFKLRGSGYKIAKIAAPYLPIIWCKVFVIKRFAESMEKKIVEIIILRISFSGNL